MFWVLSELAIFILIILFFAYLFLTDLYGLMGDPVTASDYYQIHSSCTKKLLDSKLSSLF